MNKYPFAMSNIVREKLVDVTTHDYVDEDGFFVRCGGEGTLVYVPVGNEDDEEITKEVQATPYFDDPVMVKRIVAPKLAQTKTTATLVHVGYGV